MSNLERMITEPRVTRTWFSSGNKNSSSRSVLLAIPQEYTKEYHLDQPTNVLITPTPEGLLIKKLEVAAK